MLYKYSDLLHIYVISLTFYQKLYWIQKVNVIEIVTR